MKYRLDWLVCVLDDLKDEIESCVVIREGKDCEEECRKNCDCFFICKQLKADKGE